MALISATSLIGLVSIFHLTLAYYLLTSPSVIANQNLIWIMGEAMGLPIPSTFRSSAAPTSFLAALFAFSSLTDLTAASLPAEVGSYYWSSQAPIRLAFFFGVTGWSYYDGALRVKMIPDTNVANKTASEEGLGNSILFTWGFVEMLCWFWIYVTLRDERREMVARAAQKRDVEENS